MKIVECRVCLLYTSPLTVRKTVSGKGDKSKAFSFSALFDFSGVSAPATVKFSKSGSVQNLTVSGTRINHTFTLKNGESGVFEGLPIGTKYTVSETDPDEHTVTILSLIHIYGPYQPVWYKNGPSVHSKPWHL